MKGAIYGTFTINSIVNPDGTLKDRLGGDAYYAGSGLKSCGCETKVITGISRDFCKLGSDWLEYCGISADSLIVRTDHTIRNIVDEKGAIRSAYGPEFTKYNEMMQRLFVFNIEQYLTDSDFLYISDMFDDTNMQELRQIKSRCGIKVMWQIPAVNSVREKALVLNNQIDMDAVSICAESAFRLFDTDDEEDAISTLACWKKPVLFLSKNGEPCLIAEHILYRIRIADTLRAVRPIDRAAFEASAAAAAMLAIVRGEPYQKTLCISAAAGKRAVEVENDRKLKQYRTLDIQNCCDELMSQMTTTKV